jgi:hypothetical protein
MNVWTDSEAYIENEMKTGRKTTAYRYNTTSDQDFSALFSLMDQVEEGIEKYPDEGYVKDDHFRVRLDENYDPTKNNCTTVSLCGLKEALPGLGKELDNAEESIGRGLNWVEKLAEKNTSGDLGKKVFMPADLQGSIESEGSYDSKQVFEKEEKK